MKDAIITLDNAISNKADRHNILEIKKMIEQEVCKINSSCAE